MVRTTAIMSSWRKFCAAAPSTFSSPYFPHLSLELIPTLSRGVFFENTLRLGNTPLQSPPDKPILGLNQEEGFFSPYRAPEKASRTQEETFQQSRLPLI